MRIFVTGASGWIGSAVVTELLGAGHEVVGLARSAAAEKAVRGLGAEVHRGSLEDLDSLRAGAAAAQGVVHLGYHHDFAQMVEAAQMDRTAVDVFGEVLAGTNGPLVVASGVLGLAVGKVATEHDHPTPGAHPRTATAAATLGLADHGVRSVVARFAPTVHGHGDHGFVATLTELARRSGFAGYVGDGRNCWPAVNVLDAAVLVRLGVEGAPAGTALHAVDEQGIPTRDIAEAIGRSVGVPAQSVPAADAAEHLGWIARFFTMDSVVSSAITRELTGWSPTHPGLLADIDAGAYAEVAPVSTV